jgi:hypothetical protein
MKILHLQTDNYAVEWLAAAKTLFWYIMALTTMVKSFLKYKIPYEDFFKRLIIAKDNVSKILMTC